MDRTVISWELIGKLNSKDRKRQENYIKGMQSLRLINSSMNRKL